MPRTYLPPEAPEVPAASEFNLTTERWIPVIDADNVAREVSLRDLFQQAPEVKRLGSTFAPERAALTRLLVAVLQAALRGPTSIPEQRALLTGHADAAKRVDEYLERWSSRFDLFEPDHPFAQRTDLDPATKVGSIAALRIDWASGNNVTLFDHHVDRQPPALTPAEATRALLVTLLYQPGGGVAKPFNRTDSPGAKPVMVFAEGRDLWETLALNSWAAAFPEADAPAWERDPAAEPPPVASGTAPAGLLDLLTWQSRAVLLRRDGDGRVRSLRLQQHRKLLAGRYHDPFVPTRPDPKTDEPLIVRVQSSRRLWQAAEVLIQGLTREGETVGARACRLLARQGRHPQLEFVGLRVDQAKIGDAQMARLPVSEAMLDDPAQLAWVKRGIELADGGARALYAGLAKYCELVGSEAGSARISSWQQPFWAAVGQSFPAYMEVLTTEPATASETMTDWGAVVHRAATDTFDGFAALSTVAIGRPRVMAESRAVFRAALRKSGIRARSRPTPPIETSPREEQA
ncbi:MAG: type I-E CRISPR-associated protein Cse1/CasA [Patulibacter sp.]